MTLNNLNKQLISDLKDITESAELNFIKYDTPYELLSLVATIKINNAELGNEFSDEQIYITNKLYKLGIRPTEVVIENFETYVLYWYAKDQLIINTQQQFLDVVLPFVIYLRENISPFFEYSINSKKIACCSKFTGQSSNKVLNDNPKFNSRCFDNTGEIRIQHLY